MHICFFANWTENDQLRSGCGSIGKEVASDTRDPGFESSNFQILFITKCIESQLKSRRMKKRPEMVHLNNSLSKSTINSFWNVKFHKKNLFLLQLRESTLFPNGVGVSFRCEGPLGHDFSMDGNATIECNDGHWNSRIPACRRTSSKSDFSGT